MSKILRRALKIAILPASLLITGKFLSMFFLISYFGFGFNIQTAYSGLLDIQVALDNVKAVNLVNSYSNLFVLLVILIPIIYMSFRKIILQNTLENPRTVAKLTRLNILKWITNEKTSILTMLIWVIFLWIITGVIVSSTLTDTTYSWIAIFATVASILSTWGLVKTFEVELDKIYPNSVSKYL